MLLVAVLFVVLVVVVADPFFGNRVTINGPSICTLNPRSKYYNCLHPAVADPLVDCPEDLKRSCDAIAWNNYILWNHGPFAMRPDEISPIATTPKSPRRVFPCDRPGTGYDGDGRPDIVIPVNGLPGESLTVGIRSERLHCSGPTRDEPK